MAVNTYVPAGLSNTRAYNWSRSAYNSADVPVIPANDPNVLRQTSAYEWFDSGFPGTESARWYTNPPFLSSEAGRLLPGQVAKDAGGNIVPARILRGFIRRAQTSVADHPSQCRLYFMYNPTDITRQYVSYLDQGALDPFNTIYQSGNLVAPPSFMDFSFELFFDRQAEAAHPEHPGVLVDMEYFDLVVRNVIPGDNTSNAIPDNGVMMVNPRDITVVFSPTMSIQGRPLNASVVYEKFTHRMTPTRMRINLTMRVVYLGPVRDITTFVTEEPNVARRVPFDIKEPERFAFTFKPLTWNSNGEDVDPATLVNDAAVDGTTPGSGINSGNSALDNAIAKSDSGRNTSYDNSGNRNDLWAHADCSSFVWGGFVDRAAGDDIANTLGWPKWSQRHGSYVPDVIQIFNTFSTHQANGKKVALLLWGGGSSAGVTDPSQVFKNIMASGIQRGDILIRHNHPERPGSNHVAFFVGQTDSGNGFQVFHAAMHGSKPPPHGVGYSTYSAGSSSLQYNYAFRVTLGTDQAAEDEAGNGQTPDSPMPRAPSMVRNFTVVQADTSFPGSDDVLMTWETPTNVGTLTNGKPGHIVNYKIQRALNSRGSQWGETVTTPTGGTHNYRWPSVPDGYNQFRIAAVNTVGTGPYSQRSYTKVE